LLRECATEQIRAREVQISSVARKFATKENTVKYTKPQVTGTCAASRSIQGSMNKNGIEFDGTELSVAAYQADE
jgi:hypothetical protein